MLWPCPASGAVQTQHVRSPCTPWISSAPTLLEGKGSTLGRQEPQGDSRQFSGHGPGTWVGSKSLTEGERWAQQVGWGQRRLYWRKWLGLGWVFISPRKDRTSFLGLKVTHQVEEERRALGTGGKSAGRAEGRGAEGGARREGGVEGDRAAHAWGPGSRGGRPSAEQQTVP